MSPRPRVVLGTFYRHPIPGSGEILLDYYRRRVGHAGAWVAFSPSEFRVATAIVIAGEMPMRDVLEALFGDRADGGPDGAANTAASHVTAARRRLGLLGLFLDGGKASGRYGWLRLRVAA
jgi:hypothetical protein